MCPFQVLDRGPERERERALALLCSLEMPRQNLSPSASHTPDPHSVLHSVPCDLCNIPKHQILFQYDCSTRHFAHGSHRQERGLLLAHALFKATHCKGWPALLSSRIKKSEKQSFMCAFLPSASSLFRAGFLMAKFRRRERTRKRNASLILLHLVRRPPLSRS